MLIKEHFIILFLLLPILLFVSTLHWKKRVAGEIGNTKRVKNLILSYSPFRYFLKFSLCFLALCFLELLFQLYPTYTLQSYSENYNGTDVVIAIDASNSMLSNDIKPSRLEFAKLLAQKVIEHAENFRFSIIAFAGKAYLQLPITADTAEAKIVIDNISTNSVQESGTNIGSVLHEGLRVLNTHENKSKKILIISDGEDHDTSTINYSKEFNKSGIPVYTVGVGTLMGSNFIVDSTKEYFKDKSGNIVLSKLNAELLNEIASITGAKYFSFKNEEILSKEILSNLNDLKYSNEKENLIYGKYFWGLVILLFIILSSEIFISEVKNRKT